MEQNVAVNLLESTTVTTKVHCQLPVENKVDTWRDFEFTATFRVQDEAELEAQPIDITVREVLRDVLVSVGPEIPTVRNKEGQEVAPRDVVIANAFLSDAAYTKYKLLLGKNGRDLNAQAAMSSVSKGNSKRSQRR